MSDKEPKTIEDRLVDTMLPLLTWTQQKAFGSLLTPKEWQQIAISLVPPPDSLCSNIIRGSKATEIYEAYATEALHSPSRRRRLRRYAQHRFQHMLRNDHQLRLALSAGRGWLLQWRRNLQAAGHQADPTHIRKFRDTEAKIVTELDVLSHNTIIVDQWLPPEKVLDPRFYPAIMREIGRHGYAYHVISLMQDFALHARALEMERLTPNSHILALLGLDRQKLQAPETCLIEIWGKLLAMLGVSIGSAPQIESVQLDWGKIGQIFRWMIRRELPKMMLGKNYSVRDEREVSLDKPMGQHTTLTDVLPDHKATEEFNRVEERAVLENSLELLPASQREAASFFIDADNKGKTPQELRSELGDKKYEAKQRGLERAVKSLGNLRREGKLSI